MLVKVGDDASTQLSDSTTEASDLRVCGRYRLVRPNSLPVALTSGRLSPIHTHTVNLDYFGFDPMSITIAGDSSLTCRHHMVIIDDHEPPMRELWIQIGQCVHRRFVHVTIETHQR